MKYVINLLPEKEQSLADQIIFFSFHYLRYILIITQFVAICVFFYRFKVDQEIVDLRDTLKQKKVIVDSTSSLLKEVDRLHKKMTLIKQVMANQENQATLVTYILSKLPPEIHVYKMSLSPQEVELEGNVDEIAVIQRVYQSIKDEKRFTQVNLTSIVREKDRYSFTLSLGVFK